MRKFLFFNMYSVRGVGMGSGHMTVSLAEGQLLTQDVVLEVERQAKAANPEYASFTVTNIVPLEG